MGSTGGGDLAEIKRALLEANLRRKRAVKTARNRIVPVPRDGQLAVSEQQRYLWFLHQMQPDMPVYHVPFAYRLRGELDVAALAMALREVVARHESLRTRFGSDHGVPYQLIAEPPDSWPLPVTAVTEDGVPSWVQQQVRRPFDLEAGPLFRSSLARLGPADHVLVLNWHHIITDGWSAGIMMAELVTCYDAVRAGAAPQLPALAIQPADHAAWQRRWLAGEESQRQLGYWREALDGMEPVDLPTDRPHPAQATWEGAVLETVLPASLVQPMRALARAEQMSLLAVLLAAFLVVMNRYSGEPDIAVGSALPGRSRSELEPLVGYFVTTVVLRTNLAGNPTFRELVHRCQDTVLGATSHQDLPLGTVVAELQPERVAGRNPLFQIVFTMLASTMDHSLRLGATAVEPLPVAPGTSRFDFSFQVTDRPDGDLGIWLEYSTELFDRDRMTRMIEHFGVVLAAVADPSVRIADVDVISAAERDMMLRDWNPVPVEREDLLLHQAVQRQVIADGSRVAMRFEGTDLSYRQLWAQSGRLARTLVTTHGVKPGDVVAVLVERGFAFPIALLAVVRAGGAWLPLDPQYPRERLSFQLADAKASVVVTTADLTDRLPSDIDPVVLDSAVLHEGSDEVPEVALTSEDIAYVIYTSGSTGMPKGVMVPHRAAVNFCGNAVELFAVTPADRVLQFSNPAFDVSVSDVFTTLSAGATMVGAPRSVLLDPDRLQALMASERVTFVDIPPAVLGLLDPAPLTDLRVCFIGMEVFPAELVNRWRWPGREFHNGYGPTEVTVTCVDYLCPVEELQGVPPIGRAMGNQRAYVLDAQLRPVPVGVPGELHMAGAGLARGYLGRPELTAEKFLPDPFAPNPGERMYATGDVVRWRSDGNLEFLGRADRQVKIRGLRVELGEVEHALASYPQVRQCAVVLKEAGTPQAYLAGYVVPTAEQLASGQEWDTDEVRRYLADRLPLHMVPAALLTLPELPLTSTGKLDHGKLPDPQQQVTVAHVAPATDTQLLLADIWHKLLGVDLETIGVHDNFFNVGGNSLRATQLISRIRDALDITLDIRQLFTNPTLGQLADRVDEVLLDDPELAAELSALEAELEGMSEEAVRALLAEQQGEVAEARDTSETS